MRLSAHLIVSLILAVLLYPLFGLRCLFVIIGGFLIDIDHYFLYIVKFKSLNLKKAVIYFTEYADKHYKGVPQIFIFHSIELLILLILFSFFNRSIFILTMGVITHYAMDFFYEINYAGHLIKAWLPFVLLTKRYSHPQN